MARVSIPIDALTSRFSLARFEGLRNQSLSTRFANLKPLSEFCDVKRISKPAGLSDAQSRISYNINTFSSNYVAVGIMLSIYSLISNPTLLFAIVFIVGGLWGIGKLKGQDLDLGFIRATTSQLYTGLLVIGLPLIWLGSAITTLMWLVGASSVTILGHAILMDKPIEQAFSEEAV